MSTNILTPTVSPSITINNVVINVERMTAAEWGAVPRNSIQRNEELRNALHLKQTRPEHGVVAMAKDVFGRAVKIDGHTRAYLGRKGESSISEYLVIVYNLPKEMVLSEESERLYTSYDSRKSVKSSSEEIQGFISVAGLEFKTPWIAKGGFGEALKLASSYVSNAPKQDRREQIEFFSKEISLLDEMELKKYRFKVPFLAAAILMLRRDSGSTTQEMLKGYNNETGIVYVNGEGNALWHLDNYLNCGVNRDESKRITWDGKFPTGHGMAQIAIHKIVSYMLKAVESNSKTFSKRPHSINMDAFKKSL